MVFRLSSAAGAVGPGVAEADERATTKGGHVSRSPCVENVKAEAFSVPLRPSGVRLFFWMRIFLRGANHHRSSPPHQHHHDDDFLEEDRNKVSGKKRQSTKLTVSGP